MSDECDPQPEDELDEESQAELGPDTEPSGPLTCLICMADNDEVMRRAVQHNRCWKCGYAIIQDVRVPNGNAHVDDLFSDHSPLARSYKHGLVMLLLALIAYIWYLIHLYQSPQR